MTVAPKDPKPGTKDAVDAVVMAQMKRLTYEREAARSEAARCRATAADANLRAQMWDMFASLLESQHDVLNREWALASTPAAPQGAEGEG